MRCAPIALRFHNDSGQLREASIETSRMTHGDPRATWGAVALNQAIAYLLHGGDASGAIAAATHDIPEQRVVDAIVAARAHTRDEVRSGGYVLDTLAAAFWCLHSTKSAEVAIRTAVELGSDTDTTGAVTGSLAGALYGVQAIPARWLEVLHDRDEIDRLSRRLVQWAGSEPAS
jgi:ADP-ribosyl-[dinitrogen reductase] hydrolase